MIRIQRSATFDRWIRRLRDRQAVARINARLERVRLGIIGDVGSAGGGISELRINYGPGYRLYFIRRGEDVVVLLCGGDKDSQQRDIAEARRIARDWED